jgi:hypothetical protein
MIKGYGVILIASVFCVLGCSAKMVSTHGDSNSAYAPVNEKSSRGGIVKYLNGGAKSVKAARKEDAYKKMHDFCGGPYKIVSEDPHNDGGYAQANGNGGASYGSYQYLYLKFECVNASQPVAEKSQ